MQENQSKYNDRLEINDLIGDAVKKAVARRNQILDAEEPLLELSEENTKGVTGGIELPQIVMGYFPSDPILYL